MNVEHECHPCVEREFHPCVEREGHPCEPSAVTSHIYAAIHVDLLAGHIIGIRG